LGRRQALLHPQEEDAMNHTLHHLRWLLRRFRWALIFYALAWAALTVCVWLGPMTANSWQLFLPVTGGLMLFGAFLLLDAVWQDHAPGTDTFWRTRPPRWHSVWASQFLCGLLVCLPPVVCWLVNGFMLHNTASQWRQTAPDLLYPAGFVLAVAGLGSFARRWMPFVLIMVLAVACWLGGLGLFQWLLRKGGGYLRNSLVSMETVWRLALLILLITVLLCWAAGMRRPGVWRRAVLAAVACLAAPFLAFVMAPSPPDETLVVELAVNTARKRSAEQPAGDLVFRGVPQDRVAVLVESTVGVATAPDGLGLFSNYTPYDGRRRKQEWHLFFRPGGFPNGTAELSRSDASEVTGPLIRALLCGNVRWYKNREETSAVHDVKTPEFDLINDDITAGTLPPLWLKGDASGLLLSARKLVGIPLAAGASGASGGCRVRVERLRYDRQAMELNASIWLASNLSGPVQPEGRTIRGFHAEPVFPVLYLPAVPMAVLITGESRTGGMRPWQCTVHRIVTTIAMPDAESVQGTAYSQETLRGAELLIFAPVVTGKFRVRLPEGPQQFPLKAERDRNLLREGVRKWGLPATGGTIPDLKARSEFVKRLLLTPRGYQDARVWVNNDREIEWWHWLSEEHVPDLIAAVHRDPEWMAYIWRTPLEAKLRPAALELLRTSTRPLPVSIVASAASIATAEDYGRLSHHALQADGADNWSFIPFHREMFRRLRALSGFNWQRTVRTRFLALQTPAVVYNDSHHTAYYRQPDRAGPVVAIYAALAGDNAALSEVLDGFARESLMPDEREELLALIEGLPSAGPERDSWLTANSSFLEWDQSKGQYRIRKQEPAP
jgi:hypothetical protein